MKTFQCDMGLSSVRLWLQRRKLHCILYSLFTLLDSGIFSTCIYRVAQKCLTGQN